MTEKSTIAGLFSRAAQKLQNDFKYLRETNIHSGEKGREIEEIVRQFLNGHMPKRFHATAGFVIDTDNQMSDHQDIIIYDTQSSAVFRYEGNNQIVPADAVAAIMEVKAVLNKGQLEEAYTKVEEVKKLRKTPIGEMDQNATASTLTTTGTLSIILGFESGITLDALAEHCVELNEKFDTNLRPDLIAVLDVGVINYTAQFVGMRQAGEFASATDDEGVIPPTFIHLVARADGAYSLNRMFAHLLSHLAFYPRRPSIPSLSVLLEGAASIASRIGIYQFNTERRLVRYEATSDAQASPSPVIKVCDKKTKEELATLTYMAWQDGGVIRKRGQLPLMTLLMWFSKGPPRTVQVGDTELSMVMKVTRPEFEKWPAVIEKQSNMSATLEIPPPFEIQNLGIEGTGEPFSARIFAGLIGMATDVLSQEEKKDFDDRFLLLLNPALAMRSSLVSIRKLIATHRQALQEKKIIRRTQPDVMLSERIDGPLRSHTVKFLEMANAIIENLAVVMKFFPINIEYLSDREERFNKGYERNESKHPNLVEYLRRLRPTVIEVEEQFQKMRYSGWNLANAKYSTRDGVVAMEEPRIADEPVSEYVERIFNILALAIEDIIMYGLQRTLKGGLILVEIPRVQRKKEFAQRFGRSLEGMASEWQLKWNEKGFYEA